jgi:hypothetical protein
MCVAKEELQNLLQHANIVEESIPIVFFANKVYDIIMKFIYVLLLVFVGPDGYPGGHHT